MGAGRKPTVGLVSSPDAVVEVGISRILLEGGEREMEMEMEMEENQGLISRWALYFCSVYEKWTKSTISCFHDKTMKTQILSEDVLSVKKEACIFVVATQEMNQMAGTTTFTFSWRRRVRI
uniref:Uncharacterized protein n=1 Tax=Oryza barthii TaxID=65489 RepID=A0A0D3GNB5_9ORYZ